MTPTCTCCRSSSTSSRSAPSAFICGLLLAGLALALAGCSSQSNQALSNIVQYRLRKAFPPLLVYPNGQPGGRIAGAVTDPAGQPIGGADVLVSTVRGQTMHATSDEQGRFALEDVPPGSAVVMAGAWGYDETNGPLLRVAAGQELAGVNLILPEYRSQPVAPADLTVGQAQTASSNFPEPTLATRIPFTFTLDGLTIENGRIYLPAEENQPRARQPALVIVYPSRPLNWDAASVALTRRGHTVLALGPDADRGLDVDGHVRDLRATLELWRQGSLAPLGTPDENWVLLSGSFGSLILFRALRDLPTSPLAIVDIGGIADAFLGVQALYDEDLAIPPPYDLAVAALGRPDRDPAFFYGYSPVYHAEHLPPTFVIHMLNDEVIPHFQAEAMAAALEAAGVPHELLLYEDTTHYLDAYNPTPSTEMVYDAVLDYVEEAGK